MLVIFQRFLKNHRIAWVPEKYCQLIAFRFNAPMGLISTIFLVNIPVVLQRIILFGLVQTMLPLQRLTVPEQVPLFVKFNSSRTQIIDWENLQLIASIFTAQTVLIKYNFFGEHPKSFEGHFCVCFGTNRASFVSALPSLNGHLCS